MIQHSNPDKAAFIFFSPIQFEMLRTGPSAETQQPKLNYRHFAERILMEAAARSSIRAEINMMVLPFINSRELSPDNIFSLLLALFDEKELRPTLAMLARDGCLGYRLYAVRRMIILARRRSPNNDFEQLLALLRA